MAVTGGVWISIGFIIGLIVGIILTIVYFIQKHQKGKADSWILPVMIIAYVVAVITFILILVTASHNKSQQQKSAPLPVLDIF